MDLGDQVGHDFNGRMLLSAREQFGKTSVELAQKLFQVETLVERRIGLQIGTAAVVKFVGAADISVTEVVQRDRSLD